MAKILLVEDDNNLREIFEMRLKAEGYTIVTAHDGEQALVVAMQEKPDLVISDVMMPKLSGFEMIETLKAAPEMKNVKVIMMTALGQAEDRSQGDKLGVDKYLVKSQVTLEDFVRVTKEVLEGTPSAADKVDPADPALKALSETPAAAPVPAPAVTTAPESVAPAVAILPEPAAAPLDNNVTPVPTPTTEPAAAPFNPAPAPEPLQTETPAASTLSALEANASIPEPAAAPATQASKDEEIAAVENQINNFVGNSASAPDAGSGEPSSAPPPVNPTSTTVSNGLEAEKGGPKNSGPDNPVSVPASVREKRLEPINDLSAKTDFTKMAAEQEAKDNYMSPVATPPTGAVVNALPGIMAGQPLIEDIKPSTAEVSALPDSVTFTPTSAPAIPAQGQQAMSGMVPSPSLNPAPLPPGPQTPLDPNSVAL